MEKEDINKLIRIAEVVREMTKNAIETRGTHLAAYINHYDKYRQLVSPIVSRYINYQLEFSAVPRDGTVSYNEIKPAFLALRGFLDSVIKQETLSPQTDEIRKEILLDQNKPFTAYSVVSDVVKLANSELKIVDNFMEDTSLDFFYKVNSKVKIMILTEQLRPNKSAFNAALRKFKSEWGESIEIKKTNSIHDRFIIVDNSKIWLLGPSLNRLGIKAGVIVELTIKEVKEGILKLFNGEWSKK